MTKSNSLGPSTFLHAYSQNVESSPGSSVFDLPTQTHPALERTAPVPLLEAEGDERSYIVVSGGTGCNSICPAFGRNACYVLPVSDDGGSSSEIIREDRQSACAFALLHLDSNSLAGDIRSRLIRLIPPAPASSPLSSIRNLLSHRFAPELSDREARDQWRSIVEGKSHLWNGIRPDRKEAIRGFLVYFENEVLKRAHKNFSFCNGSVGNYLLAAAQGFFRSLPSAIFFFSSITNSQADILPVLVTNHTVTIAVELADTSTIVGQCNISHPIKPTAALVTTSVPPDGDFDAIESPALLVQPHNVAFAKQREHGEEYNALPARISRLFYINAYGHEIHPTPNPEFLSQVAQRDVLIYSCGSLWTSIMPCLALRGVGPAIASSKSLKAKILLLNSRNDRETHGYTAIDYIQAISMTLRATDVQSTVAPFTMQRTSEYPVSAFITHLVSLKGSAVSVDIAKIHEAGIQLVEVEGYHGAQFNTLAVRSALQKIFHEEPQGS